MKTLLYCALAALLLLTATQCATVGSFSVKLTSKPGEPFVLPIKSVYIEVKADPSRADEEMYVAVIQSIKKHLRQEGVAVREDFTNDAPQTPLDSANAAFRPDVWVVLGRPFHDVWNRAPTAMMGPASTLLTFKIRHQRFIIQLVNPATRQDVWVGEVSFEWDDALYVGKRVVRDWAAAGLLAPASPD